jgi:hypothetical protein
MLLLVGFLEFGSFSYADRNGKFNARKMGKVFKIHLLFVIFLRRERGCVGGKVALTTHTYILMMMMELDASCFMLLSSFPSGFGHHISTLDRRRSSNKVQTFT